MSLQGITNYFNDFFLYRHRWFCLLKLTLQVNHPNVILNTFPVNAKNNLIPLFTHRLTAN